MTPGSFLGPSGEGYVRFALVPTEDECTRAVELLAASSERRARSARSIVRWEQIDEMWEAGGSTRGRGGNSPPRRRRDPRRRADGDGWVVNEWVKKAILLYFRLRKIEPMEVGALQFLDKIPVKSRLRRPRRPRRAARRRPLRVVPPEGVRPDARLREHRRLGRAAHDGRHLGHRRLLRADRRGRAPRGRRRDRRRARAAAGARR